MNNAEFFEALKLLEKEKGITGDYLLEKIRAAIIIAVKRDFGGKENIVVVMDPSTGEFNVSLHKTVVEEVLDPDEEMLPEEAHKYSKSAKVGDVVEIPPDVDHWHGAAPDSWFSHLAIECNPATNKNTWLEPVSDADYKAATSGK